MDTTPTGSSVAVLPDAQALSVAVAAVIVAEARRAVKRTGRFTIALSGGATPRPVYEHLAKPPFAGLVPWDATHVFWGDERCVEPADPRSNQRMARLALLDHVPIPAGQVYPMRCSGQGPEGSAGAARDEAEARQAADDYDGLLGDFFGAGPGGAAGLGVEADAGGGHGAAPSAGASPDAGIDLVLLGIGDDGHTASLFPGSEVLQERKRRAAAAYEGPDTAAATTGAGERLWRVTMTAPFINRTALALFVVSGASKAAVVKEAIEGDPDPRQLPARLIRPASGRLWWLLDEDAASLLALNAAYGSGSKEG
jgi:6-phosphogluconolactonase